MKKAKLPPKCLYALIWHLLLYITFYLYHSSYLSPNFNLEPKLVVAMDFSNALNLQAEYCYYYAKSITHTCVNLLQQKCMVFLKSQKNYYVNLLLTILLFYILPFYIFYCSKLVAINQTINFLNVQSFACIYDT